MTYEKIMQSPVGTLTLESDGASVTALRFGEFSQRMPSCPVLEQAETELKEYFSGERREFSLPLKADGTAFRRTVWEALTAIPYGETATYGEIAAKIGNPKACRAVGGANNKNPLPILIPCHRVVGKNGEMVGYAGGLSVKQYLLSLERCGNDKDE